jgi:drug/metabolite transporter (DMT)-like permease
MTSPLRGMYARMLVGVTAASFGAIFVRLASEASPWAIAAWRLSVAALALAPWALLRRPRTLTARTVTWCVLSGGALAIHFLLWITSLSQTTVASSVLLVSTHPLFVGIGSYLLWREPPSRRLLSGALLALVGVALVGWGDLRLSGGAVRGDLLAFGGGAMAAVYFLIGRHVRRHVSAVEYTAVTYTAAALLVLGLCLSIGTPLISFSRTTYAYLLLLGLVPQLIGHSTFNWALKHLPATHVSVLILGEPVGSGLLAILFFQEIPTGLNLAGAAMILGGIYLSLRHKEPRHVDQP